MTLIGKYLYLLSNKDLVKEINSYFYRENIEQEPFSLEKISETIDDALQALCVYIKIYIYSYNAFVCEKTTQSIKTIENKAKHKATLLTIQHLKGLSKERKFNFKVSFLRGFKFKGIYYKSLRSFCLKNNLSMHKMYRICRKYIIEPEKVAYYLFYDLPIDIIEETPNPKYWNKKSIQRKTEY